MKLRLNPYRIGTLILTVAPLPFCLMTIAVIVYFIRIRYKLYREIRYVRGVLLFKESQKNNLKNLKIRAMITNAIIGVLILELLQNSSYAIFLLADWTLLFGYDIQKKFIFLFHIRYYIEFTVVPIRLSLVPILSMLMDFLWLVYRKFEFKHTITRWLAYILVRGTFIFLCHIPLSFYYQNQYNSLSSYYLEITLAYSLLVGFLYIYDFIQFVQLSRKFYLHLKSREKEILLFYFDRKAYLKAHFIRVQFKIATIMVVLSLFFFTFGYSLWAYLTPSYSIIGVIQPQYGHILGIVSDYVFSYVCLPSVIIYKILISMNYLYILVVLAYSSCKKRQDLANINNRIRPIMRRYHDALDKA